MSRMEPRRATTVTTALLERQPERYVFLSFQFNLLVLFSDKFLSFKCAGISHHCHLKKKYIKSFEKILQGLEPRARQPCRTRGAQH